MLYFSIQLARFEARTLCQAIRTSFICAIWAAVNKFWWLEYEIRRWVCPRGCELQLSLWLGPQKSKRRRLHGHGDSAVEERMESPGNGSRDLARGCSGLAVCLVFILVPLNTLQKLGTR
ncbi:hypothetical protein ACFX14_035540 [Malus domestica]